MTETCDRCGTDTPGLDVEIPGFVDATVCESCGKMVKQLITAGEYAQIETKEAFAELERALEPVNRVRVMYADPIQSMFPGPSEQLREAEYNIRGVLNDLINQLEYERDIREELIEEDE